MSIKRVTNSPAPTFLAEDTRKQRLFGCSSDVWAPCGDELAEDRVDGEQSSGLGVVKRGRRLEEIRLALRIGDNIVGSSEAC